MDKVVINVPSDERGQFVKKIAERAGIKEFTNDIYGNIVFYASPNQFERMLKWSRLSTSKKYLVDFDCDIIHLHKDDITYGQIWYSQSHLNDWKMKMVGAW